MWISPADTSEDNIEGKKGRQVPESLTSENISGECVTVMNSNFIFKMANTLRENLDLIFDGFFFRITRTSVDVGTSSTGYTPTYDNCCHK